MGFDCSAYCLWVERLLNDIGKGGSNFRGSFGFASSDKIDSVVDIARFELVWTASLGFGKVGKVDFANR